MNNQASDPTALPDARHRPLQRMQWIALALLLAAMVGLIVSHLMGGLGAWGWLRAFCEASVVGALADWFAVVALFRHPLGLKLPHTAIIPQSKARIADNLADFVRDHFLDPKTLLSKLAVFDPAMRLSEWLNDPARVKFWMTEARAWALGALHVFDDERMQRATQELIVSQARRWDAALIAGEVLGLLTKDGRHHELLDAGLHKVSEFLMEDQVKDAAAKLMLKHVNKEWPLVVGMVNTVYSASKIADSFAEKLSLSALSELREILAQPDHPLRLRYEQWLMDYIERLRSDPALRTAFNNIKERALTDPAIQTFVASLWTDIKGRMQDDLADPNSAIAGHLEATLRSIGQKLANDPGLRDAINEHILSAAGQMTVSLQSGITSHISETIKAWDDRQLVQEIELNIGRDLQFIRINGTLVGGLAGLALHAMGLLAR
ncbi:MAG: DUF445 domain-containing protein [Pseudomonadota bacterium]